MIFRNVPRSLLRLLGAAFLCAALVGAVGCGGQKPAPAAASANASTNARGASPGSSTAPAWAKGMAVVRADALPQQARDVLALIDKGGPYPYRQDDAVFGNFEKILPRQKRGYYHEFTVRTPGNGTAGPGGS